MAEVSLHKANALQDQCVMSLFTMPLEEGMTEEARRYFTLRHQEEIHRLERRMQVEQRAAELEELEHAKLLRRPLRGIAPLQPLWFPWIRLHHLGLLLRPTQILVLQVRGRLLEICPSSHVLLGLLG